MHGGIFLHSSYLHHFSCFSFVGIECVFFFYVLCSQTNWAWARPGAVALTPDLTGGLLWRCEGFLAVRHSISAHEAKATLYEKVRLYDSTGLSHELSGHIWSDTDWCASHFFNWPSGSRKSQTGKYRTETKGTRVTQKPEEDLRLKITVLHHHKQDKWFHDSTVPAVLFLLIHIFESLIYHFCLVYGFVCSSMVCCFVFMPYIAPMCTPRDVIYALVYVYV